VKIVLWFFTGKTGLGQERDIMLKLEKVPERKSSSIKETIDYSDSSRKRNLFLLVAVMEPSLT
jgi:hypothetical protein